MSSVSISLYQPHRIDDVYKKMQIEADIFASFESSGSAQKAIEEMFTFFFKQGFKKEVIEVYYDSYWKWFVRICSTYTRVIDPILFPKVFSTILVSSVSMGFSPIDIYIEYLAHTRSLASEGLVQQIHTQCVAELRQSQVFLGYGGMNMHQTVSQLYDTVVHRFSSLDSLQKADFYLRTQEEIFEKNDLAIFLDSNKKSESISLLFQFLQFCDATKNIVPIIRSFERKRNEIPVDVDVVRWLSEAQQMNVLLEQSGVPTIPNNLLMQPFNIFEYFDTFIKKDDGVYPLDKVLTELNDMADVREEPRIRDVYYYNESTGQFEWDEALLKELELVPSDFDMSTIHT